MNDLLVVLVMLLYMTCQAKTDLHPVVLVPGSGGNQLEARLTKDYRPSNLICNLHSHSRWFRLWFDLSVLIPPFTDCFAERMTLQYNLEKDDYENAPGVETRVPYFGSTKGLLYLNPLFKQITTYMEPLVNSLEEQGYADGKNLFGAPYDFRYGLSAEGHPSLIGSKYLQDLTLLVEESSASNGGKPVIIISHSLGGLFVLQLLNRNPVSWRQKYIKHFISLSVPWGGTVQEMLTFASGYSLGVPLVDPLAVRDEQRSSESNLWLLPSPKIFDLAQPLVITDNTTYFAKDIPRFLEDIEYSQGIQLYNSRILPLIEKLVAPEVPLTCIIGTGVKTPDTLFYGRDGFDKQPDIIYGDGDGTVNLVSLLAAETEWSGNKNQELRMIKIPEVSHTSILKEEVALKEITNEVHHINAKALRLLTTAQYKGYIL